jgi:hypothetical protein
MIKRLKAAGDPAFGLFDPFGYSANFAILSRNKHNDAVGIG